MKLFNFSIFENSNFKIPYLFFGVIVLLSLITSFLLLFMFFSLYSVIKNRHVWNKNRKTKNLISIVISIVTMPMFIAIEIIFTLVILKSNGDNLSYTWILSIPYGIVTIVGIALIIKGYMHSKSDIYNSDNNIDENIDNILNK